MTRGDAESKAALFHEAEERGREFIGGLPQWRWFVPGRVEIRRQAHRLRRRPLAAGGGAARHRRHRAGPHRRRRAPRTMCVTSRRSRVDPAHPTPLGFHGVRRYVHVVARRLFLNFPGCELGADIAIASDLPRASGLSSSSALVCGVASALARRAALGEREEWRAHIPSVTALAWYLGCIENGLDYPRPARRHRASARTAAARITPRSWRAGCITSASFNSCRSPRWATCRCRATGRS